MIGSVILFSISEPVFILVQKLFIMSNLDTLEEILIPVWVDTFRTNKDIIYS